jgi:hypothetical protein
MKPAINLWLDACLKTSISDVTAIELLNLAFKLELWISVGRLGTIMVQEADCDISDHEIWGNKSSDIPLYMFGNGSAGLVCNPKILMLRYRSA